jgi:CheY-like chemotaxis protein
MGHSDNVHELILRTLTLVRRIARCHTLRPEAELQVQDLLQATEQLAANAHSAEHLSAARESPRHQILLVDDDPEVIASASAVLMAVGYSVLAANSSTLAALLASVVDVGAIVVDFHMEPVNGLELLRWLRRNSQWGDVPVAMLTGDFLIGDGAASELRALGATLHFKPLTPDELVDLAHQLFKPHSV